MKSLLLLVLCVFYGGLCAQWEENYAGTLKKANEEDKPIVLVFSGSDWCAPCIKLKRNIWDSNVFKNYANENYALYKADFPRRKKNKLSQEKLEMNKLLAERFNPRGHFPFVVVLNGQESVLGTTGYVNRATPKEYISILNAFVQ